MPYLLLLYGAAFVSLGVTVMLQARMPRPPLARAAMWSLAVFGFTHGASEWTSMAREIELGSGNPGRVEGLLVLDASLRSVSFIFLAQFGIEILVRLRRWPRPARIAPAAVALVLALGIATAGLAPFPDADALARYVLALPGSLLAAIGLVASDRELRTTGAPARHRASVLGAACGFACYGLLAGIIVPRADFPPASVLNTESFLGAAGIPVEAFRMLVAAAISGLLAEAFVIEEGRRHAAFDREREEFVSMVAHDLRGPVSAIRLYAELLERRFAGGENADRDRRAAGNIVTSALNLDRMIEDLLDASRIDARRLVLEKEPLDLLPLVEEVLGRSLPGDRPVGIHIEHGLPAVEADPVRFEQILGNLLSNAAKYSEPGTQITVAGEAAGGEVVLSVTNVGPEIPPEELPRLFDRFYRTPASERGGTRGIGLGLYIARGLVEAHGGRIWVESGTGGVTTFRFTLPASASGDGRGS